MFISTALVACGVPTQDVAQPLPSELVVQPVVPATPTPEPSATPTASPTQSMPAETSVDLWFAGNDGLVPISTVVIAPVTPVDVITGLVAGPPEDAELRTLVVDPLTGDPLVSIFDGEPVAGPTAGPTAGSTDSSVLVSLATGFASLPPNEQVLVLGQVVISISGAGLGAVAFVDPNGSPVAVPLPDGRLLDSPATASDYLDLSAAFN